MDRLKMSTWTALVFFMFGTMLLFSQMTIENSFAITIIGFYYVLFAILCNSLIVFLLCFVLLFKSHKVKTIKSIGVLLINIPIALLYYNIVVHNFH